MKTNFLVRTATKVMLPLLLFGVFPALSVAQPPGHMMRHMDDESYGQMMDERGYGYGRGYGRGYGGYGYGYGGHMGPGMMMGPMGGMMGPMGSMMMGPGYMMGNLYGLDLSDKQRDQIRDIQRDTRKKHWDLMEKMMETSDKLVDLYEVDKPDPEKIGKVYDEIFKIKREVIQQQIEVRNKIYDILNKEQREKFRDNDPFARRFGMM